MLKCFVNVTCKNKHISIQHCCIKYIKNNILKYNDNYNNDVDIKTTTTTTTTTTTIETILLFI